MQVISGGDLHECLLQTEEGSLVDERWGGDGQERLSEYNQVCLRPSDLEVDAGFARCWVKVSDASGCTCAGSRRGRIFSLTIETLNVEHLAPHGCS